MGISRRRMWFRRRRSRRMWLRRKQFYWGCDLKRRRFWSEIG